MDEARAALIQSREGLARVQSDRDRMMKVIGELRVATDLFVRELKHG